MNIKNSALFITIFASLTGCVNPSTLTSIGALPGTQRPASEVKKQPQIEIREGKASTNLNVRATPNGKKVGRLLKDDEIVIHEEKNGWIKLTLKSEKKKLTGWSSAKYIKKYKVKTVTVDSEKNSSSEFSSGLASLAGSMKELQVQSKDFFKTGKVYKGYSKDYLTVNQAIHSGQISDALQTYQGKKKKDSGKDATKINLTDDSLITLHNLQLGSLNLDTGNPKDAIKNFKVSRKQLNLESNESLAESTLKTAGLATLELFSGNEELQPYDPVGYEKVMMLNYNALAYLINGQSEAFNVARRAADWQDMERQSFAKKKEEADKKYAEVKDDLSANSNSQSAENPFSFSKMTSSINGEYDKYHKKANLVESAYVNPFSDYLIGMVMEYKSLKDRSKIDDAKRHYQKASNLNKNSKLLARAANDMSSALKGKKPANNTTLLHVVISDGAAPEKKVLTNIIPVFNTIITLQLPLLEPVDNKVNKIILRSASGKKLAKLDTIANIESMAMRHQKDSEPMIQLRAGTTIVRSFIEQKALSSTLGDLGRIAGSVKDQLSHPDTRSWSNLPASMKAARLRVPKNTKSVILESYNIKGKKIASKKVKINPNAHNFIYGRSINNSLQAYAAEKLWINN